MQANIGLRSVSIRSRRVAGAYRMVVVCRDSSTCVEHNFIQRSMWLYSFLEAETTFANVRVKDMPQSCAV